jgi:cytochrome o ubiquinol oxidase subunit 2
VRGPLLRLDWKWLFIYPEQGIATVNFVQFPKDTPISFRITSDAPMNAFWIPQLGGQVYAMAGMNAQLHLLANEEGDYKGLSSNFSGDGFSGMKFTARVTTDEKFEEWVRAIKVLPNALTREEYDVLAQQSHNNPFAYYAMVDENLYTQIIMKYMSSKKEHTTMDMGMPMTEEMDSMHSH